MAGYTKEFLVAAFVSRYLPLLENEDDWYEFKVTYGDEFYDRVGRDKFRLYCGLDAEAIKTYKRTLK